MFVKSNQVGHAKGQAGFTLLETLIYIALLSFIMTGVILGAMEVMYGTARTRDSIILEQEAHFIFRKIDWALNGSVVITEPSMGWTSDTLTVDGQTFAVDTGVLELDGEALTPSSITVSQFIVERTPSSEEDAVSLGFKLNNKEFATSTRYVR